MKYREGPTRTVSLADDGTADAFGNMRVAESYNLYDAAFQYDKEALHWEEATVGTASATHLPNESSISMSVGGTTNDSIVRQTKRYFRYQPGKSQKIILTGVLNDRVTNVRKRLGYFDAQNGIYFEQTGTGIRWVKRSFTSGTVNNSEIEQSSWNIDKMDGNGRSGITLDESKALIYFIDLEWLGVGRVRCGFVIGGKLYYAHEFIHSNILTSVYMTTANLPVRYEMTCTGTVGAAKTMKQICCSVASEGGSQERNVVFVESNDLTARPVTSAYLPVICIRVAAAYPSGGSITNRETVRPISFEVFSLDAPVHYHILYNAAITGGTWAAVNSTYSGVDVNKTATSVTGGLLIDEGYVPAVSGNPAKEIPGISGGEFLTDLVLTNNIAGTAGDTLAITCQRLETTDTDVYSVIKWQELY